MHSHFSNAVWWVSGVTCARGRARLLTFLAVARLAEARYSHLVSKKPQTEPRKRPTQSRSRETVKAMLEATARLLADSGVEALTTNHVAELAGVSIGSLYQYFPTKEALIAGVIEHRLEHDLIEGRAILQAAEPLPRRLEKFVRWAVARQATDAPLMAQLLPLLHHFEREAIARRMVDSLTSELRDSIALDSESVRADLSSPERLEVALFVVGRSLRWVINAAVLERPELLEDPQLSDELVRVFGILFDPE